MKKLSPLLSIILLNIIPIIGVLLLGWNVYQLITIFLLESVLVGVFNLVKMALAKKPSLDTGIIKAFSKIGLMLFFCFHYFFFLLILSVFVFTMVVPADHIGLSNLNFILIIIMLFAGCTSHFITDYMLPKKYLTTAPGDLFFSPYSRVWILAALIFAGGFISHNRMGNQYFYLIILVSTKLFADIVVFLFSNYVSLNKARTK